MAFTCPRCGMTSHHPEDERQGYCGNCHDWTGGGRGDDSVPALLSPGGPVVSRQQAEALGLTVEAQHLPDEAAD